MTDSAQESVARSLALRDLVRHRDHVLRTIDGLGESELDHVAAPSGWTPRSMLSHLIHDVESFWLRAVLGGDGTAIDQLRDGWRAPPLPGPALREAYRRETALGDAALARADLNAPPLWWPPVEVFDAPRLLTGWEILLRVIDETAVHAGISTWLGKRWTAIRTWWSADRRLLA